MSIIVVAVEVRELPPPLDEPACLQVGIGGEVLDGGEPFEAGDAVGELTTSIAGTDRTDHVSQVFSMGC